MGIFGNEDRAPTPEQVDEHEAELKKHGKKYEFYRYDAKHAFGNETIKNPPIPIEYNPAAADLAWQRTMEFLKRTLG